MSSVIAQQTRVQYVSGLLVDEINLTEDQEADINLAGEALASLLGVYDALPAVNACGLTISSLNITVGGAGQWLFVQGRMVDDVPGTTFTVPAPDATRLRTDLICVKYMQATQGNRAQSVRASDGTITTPTINDLLEGVAWQYVTGVPAGGTPSVPAGYELFATVTVPASASTVTAVINFMNMQQLIIGAATLVSSLNGLTGVVTLGASGALPLSFTTSGEEILIGFSAPLPITLGGTGSALQNFVDLTSAQNIGGVKTFVDAMTIEGVLNLTGSQMITPWGVYKVESGVSCWVPGSSGGNIRDNADTAANMQWNDEGDFEVRGSFTAGTDLVATGSITGVAGFFSAITATGTVTAALFSGSGADLTNLPQSALASLPCRRATGTTPNGYGSGISASIVLPNDGNTYIIHCTFAFYTPHDGSSAIGAPTDPYSSGFAAVQGSGYNSGTITTIATCTSVGHGQTVSFPLSCSGGTIDAGVWVMDAVRS